MASIEKGAGGDIQYCNAEGKPYFLSAQQNLAAGLPFAIFGIVYIAEDNEYPSHLLWVSVD